MTDLNKNFMVISADATLSGRNEINERLDNLIRTIKGTFLFNRDFGFLNNILFSNCDDETASNLMSDIEALLNWVMPEVDLDTNLSRCIPYPDDHYYLIQLYYTWTSTGEQGTYQNKLEVG